jgi:hypothetical protein
MAKQSFSTGQVLTAAQMTSLQQTAMGGGSPSTKTASYVLVAADAGTVIQMNSASATTITVNTSLFAAGDSVQIQNIGAGVCTITAGTATVNSAGTLGVTQYDGGFLYFSSASSAIWFDYTQAGTTLPLTTKGDLFGYSTTNARVPIGTNGQVLTADSTEALGLKWATVAGGGMTLLSTTNLSGITTTVSSISGSYTNLLVIVQDAKVPNNSGVLRIFPNGTGVGNVSYNVNISSAVSSGTAIQSRSGVPTTALKGSFTALINLYSDATYNKNFIAYGGMDPASTSDQNFLTGTVAITSAITSIDISTSNQAESFNGGRVLIYGVK